MARPRRRSTTSPIMEGYLTIPPDRGTILGRAVWKTRYVVIGSAQGEVNDSKSQISVSSSGTTYLSVYKNPDDWEPVQQYAVSNITHAQVQMVAHRKQGPVLPTLIVTIAPDPFTEKVRKRRSSRAATLVSNKDNGPTVLWFRTEGEAARLHEWARCIHSVMHPSFPPENLPMSPMSPMSPSSPSFQNPFVPFAPRDHGDFSQTRPPSAPKAFAHHKTSSSLYMSRERPVTISDPPSLRSRRSDLSSPTSTSTNTNTNTTGTATTTYSYASKLPSDLPSPAETAAGPFGGLIEGWTSAQGRSSVLHSPARVVPGSEVINSPIYPPALLDSGSPPGPRETILDRAFQMKYIPGSERQVPGEEKLSSLARFEALMQAVDAKRMQKRQSVRPVSIARQLELKSAWDVGDSSEDDDSDADSDDLEGDPAPEQDAEEGTGSARPDSQRTTQYSVRGPKTPSRSPRSPAGPRSPVSYNPETLAALSSGSRGQGPLPERMHSHTLSGLSNMTLGVEQLALGTSPGESSVMSGEEVGAEELMGGLNPSGAYRTSTAAEGQQRQSTASSNGGKRLSFTEFTRRLSSTSSMLLVQPNAHSDTPEPQAPPRRSSVMQPRAPAAMVSPPRNETQDRSEQCKSWRNSVGMFGNEGSFR